jgi:hypothetical protein
MQIGLIISNDWELYGDGSGDYFEIQHKPLKQLLHTVREHGAKLTVMAEVAQQWAHMRLTQQETWAREIVEAWECMLKETIRQQSDAQLHIHPQWLNAKYKNSQWHVDYDNWSIASLDPEIITTTLGKAKNYLENLLKPIDPHYECISFRAGSYCIQPSEMVIKSLLEVGFVCDTSVIKGKYHPPFYDYRNAFSHCIPWFASAKDIMHKSDGQNGLLEVPVCSQEFIETPFLKKTLPTRLYHMLCYGSDVSNLERKWFLENSRILNQRYPVKNRPFEYTFSAMDSKDKIKNIIPKFLPRRKSLQLDYDRLYPKLFLKILKNIYEDKDIASQYESSILPIVASGHTKNMHNCENLNWILNEIERHMKDKVVYMTLQEAVGYLRSKV